MKGIGEILGNSWREYKNNFWTFFKEILLFYFIIPLIIAGIIGGSIFILRGLANFAFMIVFLPILVLGIIILVFNYTWFYASILYTSNYSEKNPSFKGSTRNGTKYFWRFFGLMLIFTFIALLVYLIGLSPIIMGIALDAYTKNIALGITLGLMGFFLLIAGLVFEAYIFVNWVFSPFLIINKNSSVIESLKSSRQLVKGNWWRTFAYFLVMGLIAYGIILVSSLLGRVILLIGGFVFGAVFQFSIVGGIIVGASFFIIYFGLLFTGMVIAVPWTILYLKDMYCDYLNERKGQKSKIQKKKTKK